MTAEGLQRKALTDFEFKADKAGAFRAVVATYNVVDKDGDVSIPGALDTPGPVIVSDWNHSSVGAGQNPPVGYATITTVGQKAIAEGQFFMDNADGRAAYTRTKALYEVGIGPEWSYGYTITDASQDRKDLEQWPGAVRVLKAVVPFEVSPVFRGAGIGTQVLSMKSFADALEFKRGARLSKESISQLVALRDQLDAFIGQATPETDEPKVEQKVPIDPELQAFLRAARDAAERERSTRLIDLRFV